MKYIVDVSTGETTIVPLTADEIAADAQAAVLAEQQAEAEQLKQGAIETAKQSAKAKLAALGLTEAEITALVGE